MFTLARADFLRQTHARGPLKVLGQTGREGSGGPTVQGTALQPLRGDGPLPSRLDREQQLARDGHVQHVLRRAPTGTCLWEAGGKKKPSRAVCYIAYGYLGICVHVYTYTQGGACSNSVLAQRVRAVCLEPYGDHRYAIPSVQLLAHRPYIVPTC